MELQRLDFSLLYCNAYLLIVQYLKRCLKNMVDGLYAAKIRGLQNTTINLVTGILPMPTVIKRWKGRCGATYTLIPHGNKVVGSCLRGQK